MLGLVLVGLTPIGWQLGYSNSLFLSTREETWACVSAVCDTRSCCMAVCPLRCTLHL
ncbi:hypothetical protein F383_21085 [Gossypium arboreum]|uniref:Uncharacterized protein n=1 Tax=Gossypium arboreum TaxID=29729 RepID=A0A0B0NW87_GOSAR|nr:hypothetical protein F383_21085 [Gossypium arboreum]